MASPIEIGTIPQSSETSELKVHPASEFLDAIGRPDLKEILTETHPWLDFTGEIYLQEVGLVGGGGLGILKGDEAKLAQKLGLPFWTISLFYPRRAKQEIGEGFYPEDVITDPISPQDLGYEKVLDTTVKANGDEVSLELYRVPNLPIFLLYEPGLQYLYAGPSDCDHRLYQAAVLGFGGFKAYRELGMTPSVIELNEASTVFVALARLDQLCQDGKSLEQATQLVRENTIYTNHTLVNAAQAVFSETQFKHYVAPNIESTEVKEWLQELIKGSDGKLDLTRLAIELSGKKNGVSKIHAKTASHLLQEAYDPSIEVDYVTNGICFERWVAPRLLELYRRGILGKSDLPVPYLRERWHRIWELPSTVLKEEKDQNRKRLREALQEKRDQYDNGIEIPEGEKIACWTKRIADYKRPGMLFQDPQRLAQILKEKKVHVILSGRAHPTDKPMKDELQRILQIINNNSILKKRVHFVQDYDEEFAKELVAGIDICFNTPKVGKEADGTFWKKAMLNHAIIISTRDGGVADLTFLPCLEIRGENEDAELNSLYENLERAAEIIDSGDEAWGSFFKKQLAFYLPILSGARMMKERVNRAFPKSPDGHSAPELPREAVVVDLTQK